MCKLLATGSWGMQLLDDAVAFFTDFKAIYAVEILFFFALPLKNIKACFVLFCLLIGIFAANSEYTFVRCKKYSNEFDISHSLIRIFAINREYTFVHCKKYSNEFDVSHSLIRIFAS